jgi:uncharacterized protein YjiS (DUF1127 family)
LNYITKRLTLNPLENPAEGDAPMTVLQAYSGAESVWTGTIKRLLRRYLEHRNKRRALAELKSLDPIILKDMAIDRSEVSAIVYGDPKGRRRSCAENKIVAEGRRWCDATERELIDDITNGRRLHL